MRAEDVFVREGVYALKFTPSAGTRKGGEEREVPLHEHLLTQGFLDFVSGRHAGPLFYELATKKTEDTETGGTKEKKLPHARARQRLADMVRSLGVNDPDVSPNHAWRQTFKQIADHVYITERMSNYTTGHTHKNVGTTYGAPTLGDTAEAMKKFPRYEAANGDSRDAKESKAKRKRRGVKTRS